MVMLTGPFPDAIAPGSDAAQAIAQTQFNPKLVWVPMKFVSYYDAWRANDQHLNV